MKLHRMKVAFTTACMSALTLFTLPAHAAQPWMGGRMDTGLYIGGGAGVSRSDLDTSGLTAAQTDESDTGWKVFAGYQLTRHLAIEAAYYDLGKISFSGTLAGTPVSGDFKTKAYAVSVVGTLPIATNFGLLARVGAAYNEQKGEIQVGAASGSASDDSTELTFGLGARYLFTRNLAIRAMWDRFRVGGANVGGKNDVDLFSLDLLYRFD